MATALSIVTFNMRCQSENDGEWDFRHRKGFIAEKLLAEKPDIICCQEMKPEMHLWLVETLDEYTVVGGIGGRTYGEESGCVAFKKKEFELRALDTFSLSPTPYVAGSRYPIDQSSCKRQCTVLTLRRFSETTPFRVYNTHTDHKGQTARLLASGQLLARIADDNKTRGNFPFVMTGDLNARPESTEIRVLLESDACPMKDVTSDITASFHSYFRLENPYKIDYIFVSRDAGVSDVRVWDDTKNGMPLSDHYPIYAELTLPDPEA
jgi:endonuclease/exonuclease/phosphatase family metal-dependent hydrolase